MAGYGAAAAVPMDYKFDVMGLVAVDYENARVSPARPLQRVKTSWPNSSLDGVGPDEDRDLRHVIYLQAPTTTQTVRGAEVPSWVDSPALRACAHRRWGRTHDQRTTDCRGATPGGSALATACGTTVTTKHRVKWTQQGVTRYFGINSIGEPDNRMRMIVLACTELVGESRGL